jgi:hypothetical protein
MLRGVIELDVSGAVSFQPPKFMQRDSFSPEALSGSIEIERDVDVHEYLVGCLVALFRGRMVVAGRKSWSRCNPLRRVT